jgi:hypothetical protein
MLQIEYRPDLSTRSTFKVSISRKHDRSRNIRDFVSGRFWDLSYYGQMNRLIAPLVLFLAIVLAAILLSVHSFARFGALAAARQLFVPIACTSPTTFRWKTGTGFPVGEHLVMTARHIDCHEAFGPDAVTEISDDGGLHWVVVPDDQNDPHPQLDVRVYYLPKLHFSHFAKFRAPVLGENVTGYGVAFGETADFGRVIRIEEGRVVFSSSTAIGGMSGSAMVADDGAVIGIAVEGIPTILGGGIPSSWVSSGPAGLVLAEVMKAYHEYFKR